MTATNICSDFGGFRCGPPLWHILVACYDIHWLVVKAYIGWLLRHILIG